MRRSMNSIWWPDSNQTASGKPGAVQAGDGAGDGAGEARPEADVALPRMSLGEEVAEDYATIRMSLKQHPLALLRADFAASGAVPAARLSALNDGARVSVAGLALVRQRPGTASGVIFITLEDETGIANLVVWPKTFERYRREVMAARLLQVTGRLQREGMVIHVIAQRLEDHTERLRALATGQHAAGQDRRNYPSRDFH